MQAKQGPEGLGHHDDCVSEVGEVDHEQRQGGHRRKQELVSPAQVEHVISKAQEYHAADGQKSTDQLHKLTHGNNTRYQSCWTFGFETVTQVYFNSVTAHLVMWEAHALISHKAAEERHGNEAEEDDEEDCPTDDSLRLWAAETGDQKEEQTKVLFQIKSYFNKDTIYYEIIGFRGNDSHFLFGRFV